MAEPVELGIDEADVEAGIVRDQLRAVDEGHELVGDVGEGRLAGEIGRADAVDGLRLGMDRPALRVDVDVEGAAGREAVDQLDAADLDDPVVARSRGRWFPYRRRSRASNRRLRWRRMRAAARGRKAQAARQSDRPLARQLPR